MRRRFECIGGLDRGGKVMMGGVLTMAAILGESMGWRGDGCCDGVGGWRMRVR